MPSQGLLSGMYLIQNVMTKTGMDASEETGLVASWEIKEEDHQKWHVARMGDEWVIQHKRTLKYATAPNVAAGAILELTDEASVRYNIIQADNAYKISPIGDDKLAVTMNRGIAKNLVPIILWKDNGGDEQKWIFKRVDS